jgi:glycosyl transferase family 25
VPPPIYLINLARRPDRLAQMVAQFDALHLAFERVDAVDAETVGTAELEAVLTSHGPLGPFHRGPQCCTLSHLRTYRRFVATSEPYAVVLEDDARLSPEASRFLRHLDWLSPAAGVVKIERFGPVHQHVLVEKGIPIGDGREIARLWSKHTGSAAYIISRTAAMKVLDTGWKIDMDIDQLLFNPNVSPLFRALNVYQIIPALVVQARDAADTSDVAARRWRARGFASIERKIVRGAHELRALPRQVLSAATGRTRLVRVGYR